MTLSTAKNGNVTLGPDRHLACLEAAWELESIAKLLLKLDDEEGVLYLARCFGSRITTLSRVVMSGLSDEMATTDDLFSELNIVRCQKDGETC